MNELPDNFSAFLNPSIEYESKYKELIRPHLLTTKDHSLFERWRQSQEGSEAPNFDEFRNFFEKDLLSTLKKRFPDVPNKLTQVPLTIPLKNEYIANRYSKKIRYL